jgi:hypothetical protein
MILICLSICWISGIVAGLNFDLPVALILTGLLPLPLLIFKKYRKQVILLCLCTVSFFSATACALASLPQNDTVFINYYNDMGKVNITGMISGDPDVRDKNTRLIVSASVIEIDGERIEVSGNVLVFVSSIRLTVMEEVFRISGMKTQPVFEVRLSAYLSHEISIPPSLSANRAIDRTGTCQA